MRIHDDTLPKTTLCLLSSIDGKISTGASDERDIEADFKYGPVSNGMSQYWDIRNRVANWSALSGKTMAKIGANEPHDQVLNTGANCIVFDNSHLTEIGVRYLCKRFMTVVLVTQNAMHPAMRLKKELPTLAVIDQGYLNLREALRLLKDMYACEHVCIETGGTLNALFLKENLIDDVHMIIAPVLIGGKDTPTVVDGECCVTFNDVLKLRQLRLEALAQLADSYVELLYTVI